MCETAVHWLHSGGQRPGLVIKKWNLWRPYAQRFKDVCPSFSVAGAAPGQGSYSLPRIKRLSAIPNGLK